MYWWNIDALAEELKRDTVAENEKMKYLLAGFVAVGVFAAIPQEQSFFDILASISSIGINVVGVLLCFAANNAGDGQKFIDRFICLSWPIGVRVVVYALLGAIPLIVIVAVTAGLGGNLERAVYFAWIVTVEVWFFLWVRSKLTSVASTRREIA